MTLWTDLHELAIALFGIIQEPTHQNCPGDRSLKIDVSKCFATQRETSN